MSISEVLANLKTALEDSEKIHKSLEDARAKLQPLEAAAKESDVKVSALMAEYQTLTQPASEAKLPRSSRGPRKGSKRAPRTLEAVVMTSATRRLNSEKAAGKNKRQAIATALENAGLVASKRGETVTAAIKEAIEAKAGEIWK